MTGDREEEIVIERREHRKLVFQQLGRLGGSHTAFSYLNLHCLWKDLVWQFSEPRLEHRPNRVDVIEVGFIEEVDVTFRVEASLPMLDIFATARYSV